MGRKGTRAGLALAATLAPCLALADPTPDPYHELETKYLFGFTEGADIGAEGERAVEFETTTGWGRRGGVYGTLEQELEYESVPTQNFGYEISAHGFAHDIHGVTDAPNATGAHFSGLSTELRYLVLGRGPGSPIGFTLTASPEWARIDDFGQHVTDLSTTFKAVADAELIANRLYAAANLIYAPDVARSPGAAWQRSSSLGLSAALAYRVTPKVTLGGEAEVIGAYDGLLARSWQGDAVFVGPTLHVQFTPKVMLAAAWSTQAAGRVIGDNRGLNLVDFPHQRGNLKLEIEF
ncbi:MAG: hypothetical protein KGM15_05350 [Pseudomonadota bacterium]|nr:hypothetical protein [Pseudomonadota bacterium]